MKKTAVQFGEFYGMSVNDLFILNKKFSNIEKTDEEWVNILKKDFVIPARVIKEKEMGKANETKPIIESINEGVSNNEKKLK